MHALAQPAERVLDPPASVHVSALLSEAARKVAAKLTNDRLGEREARRLVGGQRRAELERVVLCAPVRVAQLGEDGGQVLVHGVHLSLIHI